MNLPGIKYEGGIEKVISSPNTLDIISMYKSRDYFFDSDTFVKYVKMVEKVVRGSEDYKAFVTWVKNVLGINFCQVSSKIVEGDASIEMHHGPIFTLYDYCAIILQHMISSGETISSFRVADRVLQEHFDLRVQVVMLAITNHEAISNRDLFLNLNQGIGNVNAFIMKYAADLDDEQKYKIWNYINFSQSNQTFDSGILDTKNVVSVIK